jgi:hypothetical protein
MSLSAPHITKVKAGFVSSHPQLPMVLKIGKRMVLPVRDLVDASITFQVERDMTGEGGSTFPNGEVFRDGKLLAVISYNGKVWSPDQGGKNWTPASVPMLAAQ